MPRSEAAVSSGASGAPVCGEPWCHTIVKAPSAAAAASCTRRTRPSASRTSRSNTTDNVYPGCGDAQQDASAAAARDGPPRAKTHVCSAT